MLGKSFMTYQKGLCPMHLVTEVECDYVSVSQPFFLLGRTPKVIIIREPLQAGRVERVN